MGKQRASKGMKTLHLRHLRKVLKGNRCKPGNAQTRGRKMKYTKANGLAMNKARKALTKNKTSEREVRREDVRKKARVKPRAFERARDRMESLATFVARVGPQVAFHEDGRISQACLEDNL